MSSKENQINYHYLDRDECKSVLENLDNYYKEISQVSLDYFMQKKGGTVEEFIEYSKAQACEFSKEEKVVLDNTIRIVKEKLDAAKLHLPDLSFSFAATTMNEALGAAGYTHDSTIFVKKDMLCECAQNGTEGAEFLQIFVAHELFHCITRNNPEFRKNMYDIIHFTITDSDFDIPQNIRKLIIANPDVGHHDSYATFMINGEEKDCYLVFLVDKLFEVPGDSFFDYMYTGLVSLDDGTLYYESDAYDFFDVLGANTDYCEDPEECMATNFSFAVVYGEEGKNNEGYYSPEIIDRIIHYLREKQ